MADTPWIPVALTLSGAYLAWFGVHYWRSDVKWPSDPVKATLTGKPLPSGARTRLATPTASGASFTTVPAGGAGRGQAIAAYALQSEGAGYVWGGKADVPGNWDCSSFVSRVLGLGFGMTLPGGGTWGSPGYPPNAHGPGSSEYMLWGDGVSLDQVQPGDLIVSTEHIGICIGTGQMISAMDPQDGTGLGTFPAGFPSGPPVYRRPTAAGAPLVT